MEYQDIAKLPHTYGDPVVVEPTCTEPGSSTRTCTVSECQSKEVTPLKTLGHDLEGVAWTQATAPTCYAKGSETRACKRAGCTYTETQDIAMLPHTYGAPIVVPATCTAAGSSTLTCTAAGCGHQEATALAALGHAWSDWDTTRRATCERAGSRTRTCERCGATDTGNITKREHTPGQWQTVTEADETKDGLRVILCTGCDATLQEEIIPKLEPKKEETPVELPDGIIVLEKEEDSEEPERVVYVATMHVAPETNLKTLNIQTVPPVANEETPVTPERDLIIEASTVQELISQGVGAIAFHSHEDDVIVELPLEMLNEQAKAQNLPISDVRVQIVVTPVEEDAYEAIDKPFVSEGSRVITRAYSISMQFVDAQGNALSNIVASARTLRMTVLSGAVVGDSVEVVFYPADKTLDVQTLPATHANGIVTAVISESGIYVGISK